MKNIIVGLIVIIFLAGVGFFLWGQSGQTAPKPVDTSISYKDATYTIEGNPVTLVNGNAETKAVIDSVSKIVTTYFGNEAMGDVNGDGKDDVAFLLTQNTGGTGTFYYVVVGLKTDTGYQGTNAVLLGDRIAPQTTEIRDGQIIVNYAERAAGEPMTTQPSVGVSKYLKVSGGELVASVASAGEHCGGNMVTALQCVSGYHCAPDPASHLPFGDVGGLCVKD